jgi:hypothetical protein
MKSGVGRTSDVWNMIEVDIGVSNADSDTTSEPNTDLVQSLTNIFA